MEKTTNYSSFHGTGRRKSSVARVWLKKGKGNISVNGKDYEQYFDTNLNRSKVTFQLKTVVLEKVYSIKINVSGGGLAGQADAIKLGLSRALVDANEKNKSTLKKQGLLTVDSRLKERKKYGQKGARRKFQFVKR